MSCVHWNCPSSPLPDESVRAGGLSVIPVGPLASSGPITWSCHVLMRSRRAQGCLPHPLSRPALLVPPVLALLCSVAVWRYNLHVLTFPGFKWMIPLCPFWSKFTELQSYLHCPIEQHFPTPCNHYFFLSGHFLYMESYGLFFKEII